MKVLSRYLLLFILLISCDEQDDADNSATNEDLKGKWELQNMNCFCFFEVDYDFTTHTIEFNTTAGELTIKNADDALFITESGTYPYIVENSQITIKSTLKYTYTVQGDILVLSYVDNPEIADDEHSLTYSRIN